MERDVLDDNKENGDYHNVFEDTSDNKEFIEVWHNLLADVFFDHGVVLGLNQGVVEMILDGNVEIKHLLCWAQSSLYG